MELIMAKDISEKVLTISQKQYHLRIDSNSLKLLPYHIVHMSDMISYESYDMIDDQENVF